MPSMATTATTVRRIPIVQTEEPVNRQQQQLRTRDNKGEYKTTRKVEVKTTKNTERRVQRQVVSHDGRVLARTDPEIVIDTVEDIRNHSDHSAEEEDLPRLLSWKEGSGGNVVDDSFKRIVNTRDVKENVTTTAVSNNLLGLVKRRELRRALREQRPLSEVLRAKDIEGMVMQQRKPKVLHSSRSHRKVIDTEDVHNVSRMNRDGKVMTETFKTEQHEVIDDDEAPDDDQSSANSYDVRDNQRFRQVKKEDFTEYYRVPRDGNPRQLVGKGAKFVSEEKEMTKGRYDWDELSDRIKQNRQAMRQRLHAGESLERKDALTRRPLNFHQEEKTRKKETDKWLERHFGSDWSLLDNSSNSTGAVRRSMSFSSIPIAYPNHEVRTTTKKEKTVKTTTTTYSPTTGMQKSVLTTVTNNNNAPVYRRNQVRPISQQHQYKASSNIGININQRQYNSTLSLLPAPKVDYSLHGGSSINEPVKHHGSTLSLGRNHHHNIRSQSAIGSTAARYGPTTATSSYSEVKRSKSSGGPHITIERKFTEVNNNKPSSVMSSASPFYHTQLVVDTVRGSNSHYILPKEEEYQRSQSAHTRAATNTATAAEEYHRSQSAHARAATTTEEYQRSSRAVPVAMSSASSTTSKVRRSKSNGERKQQGEERLYQKNHKTIHESSKRHHHHYQRQQPLYITEFRKEKLYPATSENNLLFEMRHNSRNYLGFRSLERSDAVSVSSSYRGSRHKKHSDGSDDYSSSSNSAGVAAAAAAGKKQRKERKRSQSFMVSGSNNKLASGGGKEENEEYVYDRFERKFVPDFASSSMRYGHSDLRLDRGFKFRDDELLEWQHQQHQQQPRHLFSREIVREQRQLEPQRFKTIIFLSGN